MLGAARAAAIRRRGSRSRVDTTPFSAPLSRMWRTSARVSIPSMPGMPFAARYSCSDWRERQLLGIGQYSRTMNPSTQGRADSTSSRLTPTLPISGYVMATSWPQYEGSVRIS